MAKKGKKATSKTKKKPASRSKDALAPLTAKTADRHALYQCAVQNVESEIDFVDKQYHKIRGKRARRLREDFCGTGQTSAEWVKRRRTNEAVGLDIDQPTLDWGTKHHPTYLDEDQIARLNLLNCDVLAPAAEAKDVDIVLAMNFSYWLFQTRDAMRAHFTTVRESLGEGGLFFCDFYGGSEACSETEERRKCQLPDKRKYTYVWDQHKFNPITGEMHCRIHFEFPDGTLKKNAFTYTWRLWTLPEIRELLTEAGFKNVTVYWEGDDGDGGGNGVFKPTEKGSADPAYICYIVSEA